jgi:hypothetical protein
VGYRLTYGGECVSSLGGLDASSDVAYTGQQARDAAQDHVAALDGLPSAVAEASLGDASDVKAADTASEQDPLMDATGQ